MRAAIKAHAAVCQSNPWSSAFAVCAAKGSASDIFAQKVIEKKATVDWKRTVVFGSFSGFYAGCFQHLVYNRCYPFLFGAQQSLWPVVRKISADHFVHVPLICLPMYFTWQMVFLPADGGIRCDGQLLQDVFDRWRLESLTIMIAFWKLWTPAHVITFGFMPDPLRITWVACVSFFWLIMKSVLAHSGYEQKKQQQTDQE
jgi:hypothetical protein